MRYTLPTEYLDEVNQLGSESAEFEAMRNIEKGCIYQIVCSLPIKYREPIILYHFKHYTYQEIDHLLNEKVGNIKNRIFRGRRLLRERYFENVPNRDFYEDCNIT